MTLAIQALVFDWGDTLMRVLPGASGPMADWETVELVPGVAQALAELGRYTCCVASNAGDSDARLMAKALERVGIRRHFAFLWTSQELDCIKPDSRFFAAVLSALDLPAAACVMIGDSYARDIEPAHALGMRTVWLAPAGAVDQPARPAADVIIHNMAQLPAALQG